MIWMMLVKTLYSVILCHIGLVCITVYFKIYVYVANKISGHYKTDF